MVKGETGRRKAKGGRRKDGDKSIQSPVWGDLTIRDSACIYVCGAYSYYKIDVPKRYKARRTRSDYARLALFYRFIYRFIFYFTLHTSHFNLLPIHRFAQAFDIADRKQASDR